MKTSYLKCLLIGISMVFAMTGSAFAATTCSSMHVDSIATTSVTDSGVSVYLRNDSGAACGNAASGSSTKYYLSNTNVDRTLAILLTAVSLGKNVWVSISGSADTGDLVEVISMKND